MQKATIYKWEYPQCANWHTQNLLWWLGDIVFKKWIDFKCNKMHFLLLPALDLWPQLIKLS